MRILTWLSVAILVQHGKCTDTTTIPSPFYQPLKYTAENKSDLIPAGKNFSLTLTSDGSTAAVVILDYGKDIEGYATFTVTSRQGDTSGLELSYSETQGLLDSFMVP
jgi:hypothetical protein